IRKELNKLSDAGYLERQSEGNRVSYRANTQHPLFKPLQDIVHKYLGLDTIVSRVLDRMGDVRQVVLTGDYAEGRDTGIINITIVGPSLNADYVTKLTPKIEEV